MATAKSGDPARTNRPRFRASREPVQIEEHPTRPGAEEFTLQVRYPALDRPSLEALKRIAGHLPALVAAAREDQFETRARALLAAFAPPDPLADEWLRVTQSDAVARSEFFERVPVLDSREVAEAAGHNAANSAQTAWRWKNAGKIFAVPNGGSDCYPSFQFVDGQPLPVVAEILKRFATDARRTAWQNAFWFASANGWLGGSAPMDLLLTSPERVLAAADHELMADDY